MRPEGRDAVERVVVSGWTTPEDWAEENQVWNWVNGSGERLSESRMP